MQTLYQVVNEIKELVTAHPQITSFYYGDSIQLDTKTDKLPAILVEPQSSQSGKGFVTFTILITCFDIPSKDRSDDLEVDSKLFDMIQDIIGQFANGNLFKIHSYFTLDPDISISPSSPNIDKNDRMLAWTASLDITVKYAKTGCTDSIIYDGSITDGIGIWEINDTFIVQ
jgi:hypothetical protein